MFRSDSKPRLVRPKLCGFLQPLAHPFFAIFGLKPTLQSKLQTKALQSFSYVSIGFQAPTCSSKTLRISSAARTSVFCDFWAETDAPIKTTNKSAAIFFICFDRIPSADLFVQNFADFFSRSHIRFLRFLG